MKFFKTKKVETKEKEVKEKNKKSNKRETEEVKSKKITLKSDTGLKLVRIVIFAVIITCAVRGALTFFKPDPLASMIKEQENFKNDLSKNTLVEGKAFSFAESFAREYFTLYPNAKDDYKQRLSKYMSQKVIESLDANGYMIVESVSSYDFNRYSDTQLDVELYAKVQYKTPKPNQEAVFDSSQKTYDTSLRDVYIKIPIIFDGKNMMIEGLPLIIGGPALANEGNEKYLDYNMAKESVAGDMRSSLKEFFKAYYGEQQTQVDYFLLTPGSIKATGGKYTFNEFEETKIYDLGNNKYKAVVRYTVTDSGKTIRQTANISMTYKYDRYMIDSLDMRIKNIK